MTYSIIETLDLNSKSMYRVTDGAQLFEYTDESGLSDEAVFAKIDKAKQARADLKQQILDTQADIEANTNG